MAENNLPDVPVQCPSTKEPYKSSYATALMSGLTSDQSSPFVSPPAKSWQSPEKKREQDYWEARSALHLRPVGPGNIIEQVKKIMTDQLKISQQLLETVGHFSARRVPCGPSTRIQNEVVVTYRTVEACDAVKSAARNLAGKGPEFGVRLELPNHLKTAMKVLQSMSYDIKKKCPSAKRNVLYDDEVLDLALDFSLGEGKPWRRMTAAQARERRKRALRDEELDTLLDESLPDEDERGGHV